MKKMYYNPKTEAVELNGEKPMMVDGVSFGDGDPTPGGVDAPARKAGNPLQGQIKM